MQEGSLFSTPSPEFIVCRFFDDAHSDWSDISGFLELVFWAVSARRVCGSGTGELRRCQGLTLLFLSPVLLVISASICLITIQLPWLFFCLPIALWPLQPFLSPSWIFELSIILPVASLHVRKLDSLVSLCVPCHALGSDAPPSLGGDGGGQWEVVWGDGENLKSQGKVNFLINGAEPNGKPFGESWD